MLRDEFLFRFRLCFLDCLVGGRGAIGTPGQVMTSECLSDLYGVAVDVVRERDRLVVVGAADSSWLGLGHDDHLHPHS